MRADLPLVIVGSGGMAKRLRARAGPNITFVERMNFNELRQAYARCKALIMTAEEDFGITPVEAMASGRPVIAYGRGGALDSIVEDRTGHFLSYSRPPKHWPKRSSGWSVSWMHFDPKEALRQARRFAPEEFDAKMSALVAHV